MFPSAASRHVAPSMGPSVSLELFPSTFDAEQSVSYSPSHHRSESLLSAVLLFRQGELHSALHALHALERVAPHDPCVLYWLGRVLVALQRFDDAGDALGMCVELLSLGFSSATGGVVAASSPTHASPSRWRTPPPTPADASIELLVDQALEAAGVHSHQRVDAAVDGHNAGDPSLATAAPLLNFTKGTAQELLKSVRRVQMHRTQRSMALGHLPTDELGRERISPSATPTFGHRRGSPARSHASPTLSPRQASYPPQRAAGDGRGLSLLRPRTLPRSTWERLIAVALTIASIASSALFALCRRVVDAWLWIAPVPSASLSDAEGQRLRTRIVALGIAATIVGMILGAALVTVFSAASSATFFSCRGCCGATAVPRTELTSPPMSFFMPLLF